MTDVRDFLRCDVARFKHRLSELDAQIDPSMPPCKDDTLHRQVLEAFRESQDACRRFEEAHVDDPTTIEDAQKAFRNETAPWFHRSWIAQRALTKPSGFAGDYQMLIQLYDEVTPATGLGGYLDLCILDLPLARAVRTRLAAVREFLIAELSRRAGDVRILDVASGPCREYVGWPPRVTPGSVEIVAMDNDPLALEYVSAQVASGMPDGVELQPVRYSALRTKSADATIRKFGRFDVIYSVGLFDYLDDDLLVAILGGLRETLNPGGVLYIAFKDVDQYDKTPYQWHLDWFFFQREMDDCLELYERAGFDTSPLEMTRDRTGIIMNFISRELRAAR